MSFDNKLRSNCFLLEISPFNLLVSSYSACSSPENVEVFLYDSSYCVLAMLKKSSISKISFLCSVTKFDSEIRHFEQRRNFF